MIPRRWLALAANVGMGGILGATIAFGSGALVTQQLAPLERSVRGLRRTIATVVERQHQLELTTETVVTRTLTPTPRPVRQRVEAIIGAELRVSFEVDKITARPNEVLTYRAVVTNSGTRRAIEVRLSSHVPRHTALECAETVKVEPGAKEPNPVLSVCLLPSESIDPDAHTIQASWAAIPPGESRTFTFRVRIVPSTKPGTVIRNHAHVSGPPRRTTPEVQSTVKGGP